MAKSEKQILEEMALLAGRINKHKRVEKQKQVAEEQRLLRELAVVSGLVNKRKRGEEIAPATRPRPAKPHRPPAKRQKTERKQELCVFFAKFGECKRGAQCPFKHDPKKVAVCTKFLKGKCTNPDCRLQHSTQLKNNIACYYFLQGICTNPNCPYTHVKVNAQAAICPDFLKGYCPRGLTCKLKHVKKPPNRVNNKQPTLEVGDEEEVQEAEVEGNSTTTSLSSIRPSFDDVDDEEF